jgi:hypothetical protein
MVALLIVLAFLSAAALPAAAGKATSAAIRELVSELGDAKFSERQRASRALEDIGAPALAALRKAAHSPDMEVSQRASQLVERIEKRLEAAAVLAPTGVRLVAKDQSVTEVGAQLARKSNFDIQIDVNSRDRLASRKVTLDTGEVTFWEALDQLCQKANLVEGTATPANIANTIDAMVPQMQPPINALPLQLQIRRLQARQLQRQAIIQRLQIIRNAPAVRIWPADGPSSSMPLAHSSQIVLTDGKPAILPTWYAGAVRIRILSNHGEASRSRDVLTFQLEVSAEPRLADWSILGEPRIEAAADDHGQQLAKVWDSNPGAIASAEEWRQRAWQMQVRLVAMQESGTWQSLTGGHRRVVQVQLRAGDKPANVLKQLQGIVAAEVVTPPEPLIAVERILQAAGKTMKGKRGGWIKVAEVKKDESGNYVVRYELEPPEGMSDAANAMAAFGGIRQIRLQVNGNIIRRQIMGGFAGPANLSLVDEKGTAFAVIGTSSRNVNGTIEHSLTFQTAKGLGAPSRLVYTGQRKVTLDIPFTLKNAKLP